MTLVEFLDEPRKPDTFRFCVAIAALFLGFAGCSPRDETIEIKIGNSRFEQIPAGKWLTDFHISYLPGADDPKAQIIKTLMADGQLREEYQHGKSGNVTTTRIWRYHGYRIQEDRYGSEAERGSAAARITVDFPDGIPFSELIPDHYRNLKSIRQYEGTAVITSTATQERLFLFGYGSLCHYISLF